MNFSSLKRLFPSFINIGWAVFSAILLVAAFPGVEFSVLAWIALIPLLFAVEKEKESKFGAFVIGWVFGTLFIFGSCWWLTFAPITYAGFPSLLAYFLLFCASLAVGIFPAIFSLILSILLKRFGITAILSAPFIWVAIEYLRMWTTGNNWNAIAYSQAFSSSVKFAVSGGIYLVGFIVTAFQTVLVYFILKYLDLKKKDRHQPVKLILIYLVFKNYALLSKDFADESKKIDEKFDTRKIAIYYILLIFILPIALLFLNFIFSNVTPNPSQPFKENRNYVIAVQPNVPMSGLTYETYQKLRQRHIELAEGALQKLKERQTANIKQQTTVIFPESPMNFMFEEDEEFQRFIRNFASKNNVSVLFNSAEPDKAKNKYFNSAVLINEKGAEIAQYDKIHLVPFGEYVPLPDAIGNYLPTMVGNFSIGNEYDLLPFGDAKAGIMICFESHFPNLSREFVRNGADVLIEMTNDGYLGNTPILRQHLASAVFRAVETGRPVLRITNVGVTAYIDENGKIWDTADAYSEAVKTWSVSRSNGAQTFYVKYGDWFAWLCSLVTLALILLSFRKREISYQQ